MSILIGRFAKKGEFAFRVISGEALIVPIRGGVGELGSIYTLNEVGAAIWGLISPERTGEEIVERVCEEFDVSRETAQADVTSFMNTLCRKGLIEPATSQETQVGLP